MPSPAQKESTRVIDRRRPIKLPNFDSAKSTARKAVPQSPIFISLSSSSATAGSAGRRNSCNKMLPKTPSESASTDRVQVLQAKLDDLANRRANLQKSIKAMTELMPQDALAIGMEARRQAEERRKVQQLREDLADVEREAHEAGLKLHRALKRRDAEAVYEPTTLWVRRVAS